MKELSSYILAGIFLLQLSARSTAQETIFTASEEIAAGSFVETLWGQVNCKDENNSLINVTNLYTPNHYAVGCVAISMATVMHHYRWPLSGTGDHSYSDSYGSSTGSYYANFGSSSYNMDLMLNAYNHEESSSDQRSEAGKLAYHAAVALEMEFEHDGSTSNVNRIPKAAANHFRFYGFYKDPGSAVFWELLDENMAQNVPVILAIRASNGAQHSIVCDGKNQANGKDYYHLNMGWWGSTNGWYTLKESWSAGGYNEITGAVFDLIPCPALEAEVPLSGEQLELKWIYPSNPGAEGYEIQQKTGNSNWEILETDYLYDSLLLDYDPDVKLSFRVRAKVHGEYYPSAWSNNYVLEAVSAGEEIAEKELLLYPMPVRDILYMDVPEDLPSGCTLQIHSAEGRLLTQLELNDRRDIIQIETSGWNPGIYILSIRGEGLHVVKKISKTIN